jgi:hypothetical protein
MKVHDFAAVCFLLQLCSKCLMQTNCEHDRVYKGIAQYFAWQCHKWGQFLAWDWHQGLFCGAQQSGRLQTWPARALSAHVEGVICSWCLGIVHCDSCAACRLCF